MRLRVGLALGLTCCANGAVVIGDDGGQLDSGGSQDVTTLPVDSGKDAAIDVFDAGCVPDGALGGIGIPAGSTASATTSYSTNTPDQAIDGDLGTYWNAGGTTGSLTITFPSPQTFDAVRLGVTALPTSDETYTISGMHDATQSQIGQSTQSAPQGGSVLSPIPVTSGTYDGLVIDVTSTQSWVAITDVSLVTSYCP